MLYHLQRRYTYTHQHGVVFARVTRELIPKKHLLHEVRSAQVSLTYVHELLLHGHSPILHHRDHLPQDISISARFIKTNITQTQGIETRTPSHRYRNRQTPYLKTTTIIPTSEGHRRRAPLVSCKNFEQTHAANVTEQCRGWYIASSLVDTMTRHNNTLVVER